jgi:membrane protein implicated in regulation of membrane protease activity
MFQAFVVCAVIGGTIFLFQFALTLMGLGGESDFELADDIPDGDIGDVEMDVDADGEHGGGSSTSVFRMLSLRTVTAGLTLFGLSGAGSLQSGTSIAAALAIAVVVGMLALVVVHYIMQALYRLGHDGTVNIADTVGRSATVYLPIPAGRDGSGKVQVSMDDRIMEYQAVTSNPNKLSTGTKVIVVDVLGPAMVEVEPDAEFMAS